MSSFFIKFWLAFVASDVLIASKFIITGCWQWTAFIGVLSAMRPKSAGNQMSFLIDIHVNLLLVRINDYAFKLLNVRRMEVLKKVFSDRNVFECEKYIKLLIYSQTHTQTFIYVGWHSWITSHCVDDIISKYTKCHRARFHSNFLLDCMITNSKLN
jgi:hypothetical protein